MKSQTAGAPPKPMPWNDPFWRGLAYQIALLAVVGALVVGAILNARENMQARGIPTGFGFWDDPARFDINQALVSFSATSPNSRVFLVGLLNTLVVACVGLVLATFLGFALGFARLSRNWLIGRIATVYIEAVRNVPLLVQLLFWYNAVLKPLPNPRQSIAVMDLAFINNRGLFLPAPVAKEGFAAVPLALLAGALLAAAFAFWAHRRQRETGAQAPVGRVAAALIVGAPIAAYVLAGAPLAFDVPRLKGFNFAGGFRLTPELVALTVGLVTYTAAFIAEIVRAGVMSVPAGQHEAAAALGLRPGPIRKLVTMPQAMRVIIPPLISQYLNLTKNSTLAVAIGYPDLFNVFAGTVLNNTGAAVQIMFMTMGVYLAFSLATSAIMNVYNARMTLKER